jgi:recombination protein RecA
MAKKNEKSESNKPAPSIKTAINLIEKEYGEGSIFRGRNTAINIDAMPTGIASLDVALGIGGLPRGRVCEIFGGESSGKTTTCLTFIASVQNTFFEKKGRYGEVVFIDAEHALDLEWASKLGVDVDRLYISQPNSGDEALAIVDTFVSTNSVDLIVIDSVAALVPKKELDGELGDVVIGAQASLMSKFMRRITAKLGNSDTTIVFINQIRSKIGVMFGNPEDTPGGRALKFYSSVRFEIKKKGQLKNGDSNIGQLVNVRVIKNKCSPPFRNAEYALMFGNNGDGVCGVDKVGVLIDTALTLDIIKVKGSKYVFEVDGKDLLGVQGLEKATAKIKESKELQTILTEKTYAVGKVATRPDVSEVEDMSDEDLVESMPDEE